jgi:hypothetical protein
MPSQSLFVIAVVGLLAGIAARWIVGRRGSTFGGLLLGLAGSGAGAAAGVLAGLPVDRLLPFAGAAVCGSTALLALAALASPRRRREPRPPA